MADAARAQLRGEKGRLPEAQQINVLKAVVESHAAALLYLSYDCNEHEIAEEIRTVALSLLALVNTRGAGLDQLSGEADVEWQAKRASSDANGT